MHAMNTSRKRIFIPIGDEIMDHPDLLAQLVPYQPGYLLAPGEAVDAQSEASNSSIRSPGSSPSSDALPAFSSNTYWAGPALG